MTRQTRHASYALIGCIAVFSVTANAFAQFGSPAPTLRAPRLRNLQRAEATAADPNDHKVHWASVSDSDPVAVQKIEEVLGKPLHAAGLVFSEKPLNDLIEELRNEYKIPILLDTRALEDAGIDVDVPVSINLQGVSLRAGLRHLLREQQLTYVIRDEALVITSKQNAEDEPITCIYDVHNLVVREQPSEESSKASSTGTYVICDYDPLVAAITECIARDTWQENGGGRANIRPIGDDLIVVSQTRDVHDQIRNLLLRSHQLQAEVNANNKIVDAAAAGAETAIDPKEVVTRNYMLTMETPKDVPAMRADVRKLIVDSFPEESWSGRADGGQPFSLTVLQDRIILQHTRTMQVMVEKLLVDCGLTYSMSENSLGSRAIGGFGRVQQNATAGSQSGGSWTPEAGKGK